MTQVVFPEAPSIRFAPEPHTRALLCLDPDREEFRVDITGKIKNESYSGCSLSLERSNWLAIGNQVLCKIGALAPLRASVVWCRDVGTSRTEVGLEYLD